MVTASDDPSVDSEGSAEMTKPNCTITVRHKEMLRELSQEGYATQSAALRAAIEKLAASVDDGETATQTIISELTEIKSRLRTIEDEIDDETNPSMPQHPTNQAASQEIRGISDVFESGDASAVDDVADDVYETLLNSGAMDVPAIAEEITESPTLVHQAVLSLLKKGIVTETDESRFQINHPSN